MHLRASSLATRKAMSSDSRTHGPKIHNSVPSPTLAVPMLNSRLAGSACSLTIHHLGSRLVDQEISIGKYVLNGGEVPAMVIIEAVSRLIPGMVSKAESVVTESYTNGHDLDYPEYTNPREFKPKSKKLGTLKVPEILLSGDHKKIEQWRLKKIREKREN